MILTVQDFFGLKPPCKGCQKRGPCCHVEGNCKEYDKYKSLIEECKESEKYKRYREKYKRYGKEYKESERYKRYREESIWRSANV